MGADRVGPLVVGEQQQYVRLPGLGSADQEEPG